MVRKTSNYFQHLLNKDTYNSIYL